MFIKITFKDNERLVRFYILSMMKTGKYDSFQECFYDKRLKECRLIKKDKQIISDLWDNFRLPVTCVIGVPKIKRMCSEIHLKK